MVNKTANDAVMLKKETLRSQNYFACATSNA